ncbi:hypothetical protein XAC1497 [Xanthomonas citri pv. citri str. 306]|uniref:Uncharacterized protein n=1 Tax=Xanthomonas axonopodis pv. citri (strain 306) TaxID=190486 RepID=A0AAI8ESG3_XANAC|nr:hypothetical protein XAC1497 [Xanthomonas citri pv. citri str. 306]
MHWRDMRTKLGVLIVAAMAICGQAKAQVACDGCSAAEMFAQGQSLVTKVAYRSAHPPVYITNIQDGTVIKVMYGHNVNQNFNWETDVFRAWGINSPLEPQVGQFISAIHAQMPPGGQVVLGSSAAATSASRSRISAAAAADYPQSAYEAIASPSYDVVIHNRVEGSLAGAINSYQQGLLAMPLIKGFNAAAVPISVRVVFADGTTARYIWKPETKMWTRIPGTARDNFNNIIPETVQDITGGGYREYVFGQGSSNDLTQFTARLTHMGVPVGTAGGTGNRVKIGCSSVNNGPPICEIMIY